MASSRIYPAENFYCDLEKEVSVSGPAASLPGRNEARTGFRMMPTFPRSPLKFRKAGFTRYGFKAGRSGRDLPVKRKILASYGLPPPFVHSASLRRVLVRSRGARCACAPP